jgi:hypothetical protein
VCIGPRNQWCRLLVKRALPCTSNMHKQYVMRFVCVVVCAAALFVTLFI